MGVTFAFFQSVGTDPSRRERLKRNARGAARHSPLDWRNLGEILLRPGAEPGFNESNFFFTVAALITTFLSCSQVWLTVGGLGPDGSSVKTLVKNLFRTILGLVTAIG